MTSISVALMLQAAVWGAVVMAFARKRHSSVFHPLFFYLVFHGLVFVVRPVLVQILDLHAAHEYMQFFPSEGNKLRSLLVSSVGLVVFAAATMKRPHAKPTFLPRERLTGTKGEIVALIATWLALGPIAVYSAVFGIVGYSFEGSSNVQMERIDGVAAYTNTTGYLVDANQMLLPLSVLPVLLARRRWLSYVPALLYVAYRATMGWGRWTIITLVVVLLLARIWEERRRWPRRQTVLSTVVIAPFLLGLFVALGDNRDVVRNYVFAGGATENKTILDERRWTEKLDNLDFANFDYLTYIVAVVPRSTLSYTYGTQYLQVFTEPIPRIIWKGKPYGPPVKFFDLNDYGNFIGLTPSLPGDGWQSGGWFGVILTMGIAGVLLRRLHNWFWRNQADKMKVLIYLVILSVLSQLFRDGGISILKFMLFTALPLLIWGAFHRVLERFEAARTASSPRLTAFRPD